MSSDQTPSTRPQRRRRPRRRRGFVVAALLLGALGGILLGEIAMRGYLAWKFRGKVDFSLQHVPHDPDAPLALQDIIYTSSDPEVVFQLKPNVEGRYLGQPLATNSLGLRYREIAKKKPADTLRVVSLGDSYAFGWGVGQDETYEAFLEQSLGRLIPDKKIEIINMGVPGYNAVMEVALLKDLGLQLDPDMVLMQYNINDATLPLFLTTHPYFTRLDKLYLFDLFDLLGGRIDEAYNKMVRPDWNPNATDLIYQKDAPQLPDMKEVPPELRHMVGNEAVERAYAEMAAICHKRGIKLMVLVPTESPYTEAPQIKRDPHFDYIRQLCARLGITTIETFPLDHKWTLDHKLPLEILFRQPPQDLHPSVIRHDIWAQAALPQMARALGGDAITTAAIEREVGRLREANQPRIAQWIEGHAPDAAGAATTFTLKAEGS